MDAAIKVAHTKSLLVNALAQSVIEGNSQMSSTFRKFLREPDDKMLLLHDALYPRLPFLMAA